MQIWWLDSAIQVALALVCLALTSYAVWLRSRVSAVQQACDDHIANLERDIKALTSGAVGVGRKLLTVEKRLLDTEKKAQDLVMSDPVKVSYNEAARLMGLGADIEDVVTNCGLSRPEAELVAALHKQRSAV